MPTAAATLVIGGVTYTATLPATPSTDVGCRPLASEARSVVAPVSSANGAAHPFLRVLFDTRVYSDGVARVDVTVENVLDKVGATTVTYDVTLSVNGQSVFTKAAVQHYYLTRWRKTFAVGTLAAVTPDIAPFNAAKAIPPYLSLVRNEVTAPTGPNFEILMSGSLDRVMPHHSGRAELAPYPDWTARYLVHRDPTQRSLVLANGDLSGGWPIHMREAETGTHVGVGPERLISLDERPNFWLDERAPANGWDTMAGSPLPIREYANEDPGPGQSPLIPDNAHQPSLAFVPYLLTGDRYYSEEMAFWAVYGMARTFPGDGTRSLQCLVANIEVRGIGWSIRNIADAAAYYPDASAVKPYLIEKLQNNLRWLDGYAFSQDPVANPFQVLWIKMRPDGPQYISLWEQTYVGFAIERANQHGFTGGLAARDAIARLHLKLFTSDPDYPRAQAGAYIIAVGTPNGSGFDYFTTMAQIWAGTQDRSARSPASTDPKRAST